MAWLLWSLAALFAWLAYDAVHVHGTKTPAYRPTDNGIPSHEMSTKPIVKRSGRLMVAVFMVLAVLCGAIAFLMDPL
jgi:hypothetical protein